MLPHNKFCLSTVHCTIQVQSDSTFLTHTLHTQFCFGYITYTDYATAAGPENGGYFNQCEGVMG